MSDDWKPGDMALCINPDGWAQRDGVPDVPGPKLGQVYEVQQVWVMCFPDGQYETLVFSPWANDGYHSENFRKVTPGTEINGAEIERERFKQGNPWKVPA